MSKHNIGDKFIIEIDSIMTNKKGKVYGVKGLKTIVFVDCELGKLEKYGENAERIKTYEDGLADAWEVVKTFYHLDNDTRKKIWGYDIMPNLFEDTPKNIITKMREWEDSKEIKRGDDDWK